MTISGENNRVADAKKDAVCADVGSHIIAIQIQTRAIGNGDHVVGRAEQLSGRAGSAGAYTLILNNPVVDVDRANEIIRAIVHVEDDSTRAVFGNAAKAADFAPEVIVGVVPKRIRLRVVIKGDATLDHSVRNADNL